MLHLDTSIVVAYLRGNSNVASKIAEHVDSLAMSSLVFAELLYGASISALPGENLASLQMFRSLVRLVDFSESAAQEYGKLRAALRQRGLATGETDAFIAATALAENAILVTHNTRHFQNVEGLRIADWI